MIIKTLEKHDKIALSLLVTPYNVKTYIQSRDSFVINIMRKIYSSFIFKNSKIILKN